MTAAEKELRSRLDHAEAEIARLQVIIARNQLFQGGEFRLDFDVDSDGKPTANLFVMRGDRSVLLQVHVVLDAFEQVVRYENSVSYNLATPSLALIRSGCRGESANEYIDQTVASATADDLLTALEWLVGKETPSPTEIH